MKKAVIEVYLISGQSFRLKCESVSLDWDANGRVIRYNFVGHKADGRILAMPPQSILGIRKIR